jgi:tetratricopeptide (TPR) repeat protein
MYLDSDGAGASAEAEFRAAISCDPKHADAQCCLGTLLLDKRDLDGAEVAFRAAIECNPKQTQAYYYLGRLLGGLGGHEQDVDGAEAAWRATIECDPKHADAHYHLANVLWLTRENLPGAKAAFQAAIECDPKHVEALSGLGGLMMSPDMDEAEAEVLLRRAIKLSPRDPGIHFRLGLGLKDQGDLAGAEVAFRCALEIDPTHEVSLAGMEALTDLCTGARVCIIGKQLQSGKHGHVDRYSDGCFEVTLEDGSAGKYRKSSLTFLSAPEEKASGAAFLSALRRHGSRSRECRSSGLMGERLAKRMADPEIAPSAFPEALLHLPNGTRVRLVRLTSDVGNLQNGKHGLVESFIHNKKHTDSSGRFVVKLDDGSVGKYLSSNLEFVSASAPDQKRSSTDVASQLAEMPQFAEKFPQTVPKFSRGEVVQLFGLRSEAGKLQNEKHGVITRSDGDRFVVTLANGAVGKYLPSNLKPVSASSSEVSATAAVTAAAVAAAAYAVVGGADDKSLAPDADQADFFKDSSFEEDGFFKEVSAVFRAAPDFSFGQTRHRHESKADEQRATETNEFLERRAKKDAKLVASAVGRQATSSSSVHSEPSQSASLRTPVSCDSFPKLEITKQIIAMLEAEKRENHDKCALHAGQVLALVQPIITYSQGSGDVHPNVGSAYQFSARALLSLHRFDESAVAATDSLAILKQCQDAQDDLEFAQDDPEFAQDNLYHSRCEALYLRGSAEENLGDLEAAYVDLVAACAMERSRPVHKLGDDHKLEHLLGVMALRKIGQERPHYTVKEQGSLYKQLRLKKYSLQDYCCFVCGASGYADPHPAALSQCAQCSGKMVRWYCGKACQLKDLPSHKFMCKMMKRCEGPMLKITAVPKNSQASLKQEVLKKGYAILPHHTGPAAIVQDPATGKLFEDLSNQDVIFS